MCYVYPLSRLKSYLNPILATLFFKKKCQSPGPKKITTVKTPPPPHPPFPCVQKTGEERNEKKKKIMGGKKSLEHLFPHACPPSTPEIPEKKSQFPFDTWVVKRRERETETEPGRCVKQRPLAS
jgi:hypothetical protein